MDEEEGGGLERGIIECTREVWVRSVNERAQIHADRLKESLNFWQQYKTDIETHGIEHIRHYYNENEGEFFYEVSNEPSSLQRFIDYNTGVDKE